MARRTRLRINFEAVANLRNDPDVIEILYDVQRQMIDNIFLEGGETEEDFQYGPVRPRAAVIAGYEDGADAETTRDQLLSALDAVEVL